MKILDIAIPLGIGDLIYIKSMLDGVKHNYDQIRIFFHKELIDIFRSPNSEYGKLVDEFGKLFFSSKPYIISEIGGTQLTSPMQISSNYKIPLLKPELSNLLCKGDELDLNQEYIVLTTKIRYLSKSNFAKLHKVFFDTINKLSQKYKIIILGERVVEMNNEYIIHTDEYIYSIYNDIMSSISADKLLDLTIPALGITTSNLSQIQQDCLIMNKAKIVITLGVGGNFSMATAVANTVGYREDTHDIFEVLYKQEYNNAIITKDWNRFISVLTNYI